MKKLGLIALMTLSLNSFASDTLVASCTTIGDALDSVDLFANSKGLITTVKVNSMDPEASTVYTTMEGLSSFSKDGMQIIAAEDEENIYGGGINNAIILDVDSLLTGGMLAENGSVYILNCSKK